LLIRQLSAHTRLKQFSETSVFTYRAGREGGLVGTFSFWYESSNKPLMSVVKKDVEKYRSSRGSMYSAERIHELSPQPGLQKGVVARPHRCSIQNVRERLHLSTPLCLEFVNGNTKLEEYKQVVSVVEHVISQFSALEDVYITPCQVLGFKAVRERWMEVYTTVCYVSPATASGCARPWCRVSVTK
jgi:hypothetical protein